MLDLVEKLSRKKSRKLSRKIFECQSSFAVSLTDVLTKNKIKSIDEENRDAFRQKDKVEFLFDSQPEKAEQSVRHPQPLHNCYVVKMPDCQVSHVKHSICG